MPLVTVSSKHQITLPADIIRALGIQGGDKLAVEAIDDRIVAIREPQSWAGYMRGSALGVYGQTTHQIDRYVAEERASWGASEPTADIEDFVDYYVAQEGNPARRLIDALAGSPFPGALSPEEIARSVGEPSGRIEQLVRDDLGPAGWVKRIPVGTQVRYRLRRDLAEEVRKATAA